jgi:hypothetical protein
MCAGTRLGEHLGRKHSQREADVEDLGGQTFRCSRASLDDHAEPDLLGVGDPVVELRERLALVQIRRVDRVPGGPQLVGKSEESLGLPLRVVKQQYLRH